MLKTIYIGDKYISTFWFFAL